MIKELKLKHRQKKNLKGKNGVKLRKYLEKRCHCSGKIFQYKNVYNKFPIRTQLRQMKINRVSVDHVWIECEDLYKYFLKGEAITFIADVYFYCRNNGTRAYSLCNLQNIKTIK